MNIGSYEIVIILLVILLVFNKNELPGVIKSLVRTIKHVKKTAEETKKDFEEIIIDRDDMAG